MKRMGKELLAAAAAAIVLPGLVLAMVPARTQVPEQTSTAAAEEPSEDPLPTVAVLLPAGQVEDLPLADYLTGVVLAEMPADFAEEALKAQAVVSATYALRREAGSARHGAAAVCTDSACCQGYCDPETYLAQGGSPAAVEKVRRAVEAVAGQVLTYDGALIEATFFSSSGGYTEDAVAVWGSDVPYLQATPSPGETSQYNSDCAVFSVSEVQEALGLMPSSTLTVGEVTYTAGGGVAAMVLSGETFTGPELRQKLGLRSTAMELSVSGDTVTIVTHGYGHRVGMSQYGAQAMALSGSGYEEILTHYYRGAKLETVVDNA